MIIHKKIITGIFLTNVRINFTILLNFTIKLKQSHFADRIVSSFSVDSAFFRSLEMTSTVTTACWEQCFQVNKIYTSHECLL